MSPNTPKNVSPFRRIAVFSAMRQNLCRFLPNCRFYGNAAESRRTLPICRHYEQQYPQKFLAVSPFCRFFGNAPEPLPYTAEWPFLRQCGRTFAVACIITNLLQNYPPQRAELSFSQECGRIICRSVPIYQHQGRTSTHFFLSFHSLIVFTAKRWIRSPCLPKFLYFMQCHSIVIGVVPICRHRALQYSTDIFHCFTLFTTVRQNHYQCCAKLPVLQQCDRINRHTVPICRFSDSTAEPFRRAVHILT